MKSYLPYAAWLPEPGTALTSQEKSVLDLLAQHVPRAEIARRLDVQPKDVARTLRYVAARRGLDSSDDVVAYAIARYAAAHPDFVPEPVLPDYRVCATCGAALSRASRYRFATSCRPCSDRNRAGTIRTKERARELLARSLAVRQAKRAAHAARRARLLVPPDPADAAEHAVRIATRHKPARNG